MKRTLRPLRVRGRPWMISSKWCWPAGSISPWLRPEVGASTTGGWVGWFEKVFGAFTRRTGGAVASALCRRGGPEAVDVLRLDTLGVRGGPTGVPREGVRAGVPVRPGEAMGEGGRWRIELEVIKGGRSAVVAS